MFGNTLMWPQVMRIYLLLCTCCETCPAVYHLQCVDPPLEHVPQEDWQCPVCTAEFSKGETDCKFYVKQSGVLCRQVFLRNLFGIVKLFELFLSPCRIAWDTIDTNASTRSLPDGSLSKKRLVLKNSKWNRLKSARRGTIRAHSRLRMSCSQFWKRENSKKNFFTYETIFGRRFSSKWP